MHFWKMAAIFAALVGCGPIQDEAGYLGGYTERKADEHLFAARSQQQRADRYLMSLVILAPVAADFAETSAEAKSIAAQINEGYRILDKMYAEAGKCLTHAEKTQCKAVTEPGNSAFSFENHAYEMQRTLYSIAKQSLDAAKLDKVLDDILEMNLLGLLRAGSKAIPVARRVLATYRDTVVTFASAAVTACDATADKTKACGKLDLKLTQMKSGTIAKSNLLSEHEGRMVRALVAAIDKATKQGGGAEDWALQSYHVFGLMAHLDRSCTTLTSKQLTELNELDLAAQAAAVKKIENCAGSYSLVQGAPVSESRNKLIETIK